jgi:hypothetical protein
MSTRADPEEHRAAILWCAPSPEEFARRFWTENRSSPPEMPDFAAEHDVTADIELIDAQDINTAYERIRASDVRYRFVIDGATFAKPKQA